MRIEANWVEFGRLNVDAIFFTGDLSTGGPEQWDHHRIHALFQSLWRSAPIPLIMVPGNHDCHRVASSSAQVLRYFGDDIEVQRNFSNDHALLGVISEAFEPFTSLRAGIGAPIDAEGMIAGDFRATLNVSNDLRVGIIGLNTAFNGVVAGQAEGVLDPDQALRASDCSPDHWASKFPFRVLLTHYPPSGIHPKLLRVFNDKIAPPGRFQLCLSGSRHDNSTGSLFRADRHGLNVQAPPFHAVTGGRGGYIFGEADVESGRVRLRICTYGESTGGGEQFQEFMIEVPRVRKSLSGPTYLNPSAPTPPVAIESVELSNFRCFPKVHIPLSGPADLHGRWTCLAGLNGSGKTAVLQAISILLLGDPSAGDLGAGILERMRRKTSSSSADARLAIELGASDGRYAGKLEVTILADGKLRYHGEWARFRDLLSGGVLLGYGATRNLSSDPPPTSPNTSKAALQYRTLFEPLAQLSAAEVLVASHPQADEVVPLFSALVQAVFGEELRVAQTPGTIRFRSRHDVAEVPALDLPDGFRSSVAWLADLCTAWCEKNPGKGATAVIADISGIVLIDEIDLHLHPSLQRSLVTRLRNALPRVQWIVTTHSPLVLANFHSSEIVVLESDPPGRVRTLDREIIAFSSDEIYEYLMGTRPTGTALSQLARDAEKDPNARERLAEVLRMSPEASAADAKQRLAAVSDVLESLDKATEG